MKTYHKQSGMAGLEILLIAAVVGLIGFVGYRVYDSGRTVDDQYNKNSSQNSQRNSDEVPLAPEVNSVEDLDAADKTLDQVHPENSHAADEAQLDGHMSSF
ncbi:hypothetical protein H0X09_01685 [Candidatus Saccharibacteria bacterium]|nr:hypothetical protein [Candidatus Saccharibacteria bacterium]